MAGERHGMCESALNVAISADCFGYCTVLHAQCFTAAFDMGGWASQADIWTNDPLRKMHTQYASQSAALLDQTYKYILFLTTLSYRHMSAYSLNRSLYSIPVLTVQSS